MVWVCRLLCIAFVQLFMLSCHLQVIALAKSILNDHPQKKMQPHIIFMVADDMGWNDFGLNNPDILSLSLNELATEGIFLNHSYMQHVCGPSRAAFLTGYYPFRTGMQHQVLHGTIPAGLPLKFPILADKLKELGYATHAVGKWNLGFCDWKYTPTFRGFDSFFGIYQPTAYYYNHTSSVDGSSALGYDLHNNTDISWQYFGVHSSKPFVERAKEIIRSHDSSVPLFLYLPFQYVHLPHQVPQQYVNLYSKSRVKNVDRRVFSGMVSALDEDVRRIISFLKAYHIYDNSVIVFTSDNGGHPYSSGNNYPLRGAKGTLFEGGTRVPAFIHSHKLIKRGFVYNGLMHAVDWFATLVSLAGGQLDDDIDGIDMWEAVTKNLPSPRTEMVYGMDNYTGYLAAAIRDERWKLIVGEAGTPDNWIPPENVTGQFRNALAELYPFFDFFNSTQIRLFDLKDDPSECNDLSEAMPEKVEYLRQRLSAYKEKMVPSVYQNYYEPLGDPKLYDGSFKPGFCQAIINP